MQARSQMFPGDDIEPQIMKPTAQSKIVATSPCAILRLIPVMALLLSRSRMRKGATPGRAAFGGTAFHYSSERHHAIRSNIPFSRSPRGD